MFVWFVCSSELFFFLFASIAVFCDFLYRRVSAHLCLSPRLFLGLHLCCFVFVGEHLIPLCQGIRLTQCACQEQNNRKTAVTEATRQFWVASTPCVLRPGGAWEFAKSSCLQLLHPGPFLKANHGAHPLAIHMQAQRTRAQMLELQ